MDVKSAKDSAFVAVILKGELLLLLKARVKAGMPQVAHNGRHNPSTEMTHLHYTYF